MPIIRSEISYRPISAEKVTIDMDIWRFNFGWVQKTREVTSSGGGDSGAVGVLNESSTLLVSGDPNKYVEKTYTKGLPASLTCPGTLVPTGSCVVGSYNKVGTLNRVSTMIRLSGDAPEMYSLGTVDFGVVEEKGYMGAIPKGATIFPALPVGATIFPTLPTGSITDHVMVSANGVSTVTTAVG